MSEESGSVLEARKSALRRYHEPFTSRLWRPFLEIQLSFGRLLSMSASSSADGNFMQLGHMRLTTLVSHDNALPLLCAEGGFLGEEFSQMLLHIEPRGDRLQGGVGVHLCGVEVQLLAPNQPDFDAQLHVSLEKLPEHRQ